ncbi:flavodoxin family protein [Virgibacillus flavescens]|uniref:flavodoxin family protein n=1 Tax=Virgibacillus flavescens TaxID=1611422 RepID=UPI003D324F3B
MSIAVIDGGTRESGNTEILTEKVIQNLAVEKIQLSNYEILPVKDLRHTEDGFSTVEDDYNSIIDRMLPHDVLIFSTPIYWYSTSGTMKNFIDRWSQTFRDADYPDFKEVMAAKKAYVISVGGDNANLKGLPMIQQFNYIFDFAGITFEDYILGNGNKPGDIAADKAAIQKAEILHEKLSYR